MPVRPTRIDIYRTSIPMRRFEHATASRAKAESVIIRLQCSDGNEGWGETLPRDYVTGETLDSVIGDLENIIIPAWRQNPQIDAAFLPQITPTSAGGRCINAAACAAELAAMRWTLANNEAMKSVLETSALNKRIITRVSGVLGGKNPSSIANRLRLMRLFGLRDFKLKLGLGEDIDAKNLRTVQKQLSHGIKKGKYTLRVDVNGAWEYEIVPGRVQELQNYGVCAVEQPSKCSAGELVELAGKCGLPLMADESLISEDNAATLLSEPRRVWWNIRISKNGGLSRAARLARMAAGKGIKFTIGCMVGESSILSAAQRRLLQLIPSPQFVEGNYGRFLMSSDVTDKSLRFGYGGRLKALREPGLGISVKMSKIDRYTRFHSSLQL